MKKIALKYSGIVILFILGATACNDFEDNNFDFSDPLPQYVELADAIIDATAGEAATVEVRVRVALQSKVTVNYEISGDISESGTVEIAPGAVSGTKDISIPASPESGLAMLKITSVDNGLSIGRGDPADDLSNVALTINWTP
jgi:hypothetical protein